MSTDYIDWWRFDTPVIDDLGLFLLHSSGTTVFIQYIPKQTGIVEQNSSCFITTAANPTDANTPIVSMAII